MSKKNYNVVLNSNFCTFDSAGNTNSNKNYYIDWSSILPDKKFKLTFSFISKTCIINTLVQIPIITIDFLNQANNYKCQQSSTTYQATSSNILGLIFPSYLLSANSPFSFLRADKDYNTPIYLSRPRQNYFNVSMINNNNPPVLWVDESAPTPLDFPAYVLILSFEECE